MIISNKKESVEFSEGSKEVEAYLVNLFKHMLLDTDAEEVKNVVEKSLVVAAMSVNNYSQAKCARELGVNRGTFRSKLKKHGLIGG